ncbi:hypothetical protein SAMN04488522_106319 [Pedobacter caeni]|uniref:Uncharacterized protein n=1 Tax=Pedobacter caeni TaxID=288992 RepID=A0A1M5LF58_9SPHI|nr:hypothetical protein SAMN04488522_106319 [Pedobacter caeni]
MKFRLIILVFTMFFLNDTSAREYKKPAQKNISTRYMLNFEFSYPAEILVNDMVAEINLENAPFSPCNLNAYLLDQKEQKIKIKIFHPDYLKGGLIQPEIIQKLNKELAIYKYKIQGEDILHMEELKKIDFPDIKAAVPYLEYEWTFHIDTAFKTSGWSNAADLSKMDKNLLKKEVLNKYEDLRAMLNKGEGARFLKEISTANDDFFMSNSFSDAEKKAFVQHQLKTYHSLKGLLLPIEHYRIRMMGEGKVVALERVSRYKGQGVLVAADKKGKKLYFNYVMLCKPLNSTSFKVIRINSFIQDKI